MLYSDALANALAYAANAHNCQTRKGTEIPYLSHLLAVTAIVQQAGGNETEAIAAVLHDVVEDQPFPDGGGRARLADVRAHFGIEVASIVESLSDWISSDGHEKKTDSDYRARKAAYHEHLRATTNESILLVSAADKLHNAASTVSDLKKLTPEERQSFFERFSGTREDIIWNYRQLIDIYEKAVPDVRRDGVTDELTAAVDLISRMTRTLKMFYGIVPHVRGSVLISGSSNFEYLSQAVAVPLNPEMDYEDPRDQALLERLLSDVVASGHYSSYVWEESDES